MMTGKNRMRGETETPGRGSRREVLRVPRILGVGVGKIRFDEDS